MASHPRLAQLALEQSEEAEDAAGRTRAHLRRALADGEITAAMVAEGLRLATAAHEAARDAVVAVERTSVGELIAASVLTGQVNVHVAKRAVEVGLMLTFPTIAEDYPLDVA